MRLLIVVLVGVAVPRLGYADGLADEADLQFQIGAEAYRKADYTSALEHFLSSNRLVANRNVMFNIARSYEQLGKFPEAFRYYNDARGEPDQKIVTTVEAAIERISLKVAIVRSTRNRPARRCSRPPRLGSVGTTPARLGLNAGTYKILIEAPGHEPHETTVTVTVGGKTKVERELVESGTLEIGGDLIGEVDDNGPVSCITPRPTPPGPHASTSRRATPRSRRAR